MKIELDFKTIKDLIGNKIIVQSEFLEKSELSIGIELYENESPLFSTGNQQAILFSQVKKINIQNKDEKEILTAHFNVPPGIITENEIPKRLELPFNENTKGDITNLPTYIFLRRGIIHLFINTYENSIDKIDTMWDFLQSLQQTDLLNKVLEGFLATNDFPLEKLTAKTATSTKNELAYIWFGRTLISLFLNGVDDETTENHKSWLRKSNPTKDEFKIEYIPENFSKEQYLVIAYLMLIRKRSIKIKTTEEYFKQHISNHLVLNDIDNDAVFFWMLLIEGCLLSKYDDFFATPYSREWMKSFEIKALELAGLKTGEFEQPLAIQELISLKNGDADPLQKCFTSYLKTVLTDKESIRMINKTLTTRKDILNQREKSVVEINKICLNNKKLLLITAKDSDNINNYLQITKVIKSLRNVMIIYKSNDPKLFEDAVNLQIQKNKWASKLQRDFKIENIEILFKNIDDTDDREIRNNLKAFLSKYDGIADLLFVSDNSSNSPEYQREQNWLLSATSPIPIFSEDENYLFYK